MTEETKRPGSPTIGSEEPDLKKTRPIEQEVVPSKEVKGIAHVKKE